MDSPDRTSAPPQFLAEISLLPTERGGRTHPLRSPARLELYFDAFDWPAVGYLRDQNFVYPGRSAWIELHVENWPRAAERLYPGKPFVVREREEVVAYGLVKQILSETPDAESASEEAVASATQTVAPRDATASEEAAATEGAADSDGAAMREREAAASGGTIVAEGAVRREAATSDGAGTDGVGPVDYGPVRSSRPAERWPVAEGEATAES